MNKIEVRTIARIVFVYPYSDAFGRRNRGRRKNVAARQYTRRRLGFLAGSRIVFPSLWVAALPRVMVGL